MLWMIGAAVLGYALVGYPVLVAALARLVAFRPRVDPAWQPAVTVAIAAYNVAEVIDAKLASLEAQDYPPDKLEVIVYSDGSTDGTAARVAAHPRVRLIDGGARRGKPTGLNTMAAAASGEVVVITDARQRLDPGVISALVAALSDEEVGCATGNLLLEGAAGSGVYWRYENWIRQSESAFRGMVGMTGPLAAVRRADLKVLPADIILDDVWIPATLPRARRRVALVTEAVARDRAFADQRELGRKVRTLAGNYQIIARLPHLLVPVVNPHWFEFVSHKVMRLLCPWALLAVAAGSIPPALAGCRHGLILAAGQVSFYAAAALGARAGRAGTVARTFLVLQVAAVIGLGRFLTGRQRVTW